MQHLHFQNKPMTDTKSYRDKIPYSGLSGETFCCVLIVPSLRVRPGREGGPITHFTHYIIIDLWNSKNIQIGTAIACLCTRDIGIRSYIQMYKHTYK